ncbi:MAG: hypothetical protein KAU22_09950 [Desulfuromonadales bacterium]|nr:hypothetical protein [Desulfuromonadales bacterium]
MQGILDELKVTPGVLGAAVYKSKQGIIASNMPEIFKADTQKRIGNILHRIFKLNETVKLDVNSIEAQYDEALLLVKKLCDSSSLIIICEPDAKSHLINMSVSMLLADLLDLIEDCEPAPVPAEPAPAPHQPADLESVLNGPLSEKLAQIKRALAKRIGPVAGKALKIAVEKWLLQGEPSPERLGELAVMLRLEIDDKPSQAEFLDEIRDVI